MQRIISQMKEQDKTPRKTNKWSGDRQPSRNRIQKTRVKMTRILEKEWEDARNIYWRLRRTKEQTEKDEQYTGRNQRQENWGRGTDTWQNCGNHCCKTEYRKKNEKKWRQPKRHPRQPLKTPTFALQGSQKEKRKRERTERILEETIAENFRNMERK